jgi:hypothetical protein
MLTLRMAATGKQNSAAMQTSLNDEIPRLYINNIACQLTEHAIDEIKAADLSKSPSADGEHF